MCSYIHAGKSCILTKGKGVKMIIKLFEEEEKSSADVINQTVRFVKGSDGKWSITFRTVMGQKGYGTQKIPVSEFTEVLQLLREYKEKGIANDEENPTCTQVISRSIKQSKDGAVRFKTESGKGKKPTKFKSFKDFCDAVEALEKIEEIVIKQGEKLV